jgi:hypothetical protein
MPLTYFIRHKNPKEKEIPARLFDEKRIAIYFDREPWEHVFDIEKLIPHGGKFTEEYKKAAGAGYARTYASALNLISQIQTNGGYIFAEYGDSFIGNMGNGCILGQVEAGTPVENVDGISPVTLRMKPSTIKIINYADYPVLLAIRPPYGTICCPSRNTYKTIADYHFDKKDVILSSDLLHPKMAEQMCVEYLRSVGLETGNSELTLSHCFLQPGKTLATIDIAGRLHNGKSIFAQVKNGEIRQDIERDFFDFVGDKAIGVIFSKFIGDHRKISDGRYKVNIDGVFSYFTRSNRQLLVDLIGAPGLFS